MNISSFLIGYQAGKKAGGGSSSDVRYVTFMSDDGTVELGKLPVATGYDCPNPKFAVTKESTAQFNFTHDYWATEPNGATDSDALKAVTEDRVVYATFISVLRHYTITYIDGEETVNETLAYGSMPSYTPDRKEGYSFDGWEPTLATVTGDANYYAQWSKAVSFAGSTWADIAKVCDEGRAASVFSVGDERVVTMNVNGVSFDVTFRIVGIDHDNKEDGTKAGISVVSKTILDQVVANYPNQRPIGSLNGSTRRSWPDCDLREKLNSYTIGCLPADLVEHIKPVVKESRGIKDSAWASLQTVDRLWIPSLTENGLSASPEGGSVYAGLDTDAERKGYLQGRGTPDTSAYVKQGTRSHSTQNSSFGAIIKVDGKTIDYEGYSQYRIGFCI